MSDNEQCFTERVLCDYDLRQQAVMKLNKQNVLNDIKVMKLKGTIIHENQKTIAKKVVNAFKNKKIINIMVVSKTQSGKTGSMCATIKRYLKNKRNLIPIGNIYIITGLSSCEWKEQTKVRLPVGIRVYHRCELPNTFVDEIKNNKNILIIMDEIQVAAKKGQTIYNAFKSAGLLDKSTMYKNDVKILEYTATPDGTIYDLMKWNDASAKILADVGEGYVSAHDLLKLGRVKQFKELCGYNEETGQIDEAVFINIQEIKDDIDKYKTPLYHIIRTRNGTDQTVTRSNFMEIFKVEENTEEEYDFITYDRKSEIEDINKILEVQPEKHTFIFIKEMLRCAKTLTKRFIGILYDRYNKNPDDSTIIQGLSGRDTGYDNNKISICYTNVDSIVRYEQLWLSEFGDTTIMWNSKTTVFKDGNLSSTTTFNCIEEDDTSSVSSDDTDKTKPHSKTFEYQAEAKAYYNTTLKSKLGGRGPNLILPNPADGYYYATIRSKKRVYSEHEIKSDSKHGLTKNNYRYYACYTDINNQSTLKFVIIHDESLSPPLCPPI